MVEQLTLAADEGELVWLKDLGARFMIRGARTDGRFALVEHVLGPRALGAPLHTHAKEDEYSYILEGEVGVQIGNDEQVAGPGKLVVKPRGIPHAFWNAGDAPARLLEIVSPGGFEQYFEEAAPAFINDGPPDFALLGALAERYQLNFDFASIPALAEKHGLMLG